MSKILLPSLLTLVVFSVLTGLIYPFVVTGIAAVCCARQAQGSLIRPGDRLVGSSLLGHDAAAVQRRQLRRLESGADQPGADRRGQGAAHGPAAGGSRQQVAGAGGSGDGVGQRTRSAYQPGGRRIPDSTGSTRARHRSAAAARPGRRAYASAPAGRPGRASRQCT